MAIARRSAARYAEVADLAGLGLPAAALAVVRPYVGPVTRTGGASGATLTPGGFPAGIYDLRVRVSTGGALGAALVEVSTNGGTTYAAPVAVPSSGVVSVAGTTSSIASGLTLTFVGTLVLADVYACDVASSVERALDAASDWLDSYLRRRYTLPLTAWDIAVRQCAAARAGLLVMQARGYDPSVGSDKSVGDRADGAEKWAEKLAQGWVTPDVTDSSEEEPAEDVVVVSNRRRGW